MSVGQQSFAGANRSLTSVRDPPHLLVGVRAALTAPYHSRVAVIWRRAPYRGVICPAAPGRSLTERPRLSFSRLRLAAATGARTDDARAPDAGRRSAGAARSSGNS